MNGFTHSNDYSLSELIGAIEHFGEAGIDPAFDADMEELERQFQERRLHQPAE